MGPKYDSTHGKELVRRKRGKVRGGEGWDA